MVRSLRYIIAFIAASALVLGVAVTTGWAGTRGAAATRQLAVQSQPVVAPANSFAPVVATTATTVPATTTTPTTVPATTTTSATTPPTRLAAPPAATRAVARPAVATQAATATIGGDPSDFALLGYRWDPCAGPITVSSSGPDVTGIVSELDSLTGLDLVMVSGPTADINVSWGGDLAGSEGGLTTWAAVGGWLSHITIVISPASAPYMSTVLHHEMGHAVGLGHAKQPNEVMYPIAHVGSPTDYQAGDRAGLRTVGVSAGCTPSP